MLPEASLQAAQVHINEKSRTGGLSSEFGSKDMSSEPFADHTPPTRIA